MPCGIDLISSNRSHLTSPASYGFGLAYQKIFPPRTINQPFYIREDVDDKAASIASPGSSCLSENIDHSRTGQQHVHRPAPPLWCGGDSGIISAWCHVLPQPLTRHTHTQHEPTTACGACRSLHPPVEFTKRIGALSAGVTVAVLCCVLLACAAADADLCLNYRLPACCTHTTRMSNSVCTYVCVHPDLFSTSSPRFFRTSSQTSSACIMGTARCDKIK
jgi:hypothetical protein